LVFIKKFPLGVNKFTKRLKILPLSAIFYNYLHKGTFMKKLLFAILMVPALALAWEPSKLVHTVIGFAPGSGNEISFRKASDIVMKQNPGITFVIETKPGADASVASNQFMTAPSDGLHLMVPSHMSLFVTNDIWQKSTKRFEYNSFKPELTLGKSPLVLVASVKSSVNTPQEFVKYINSGRPINIAVGGGAHRMAFEYIRLKTGADSELVKDIRFQGPLPAVTSVAQYDGKTGTEFGIMPMAIAKTLIDAGKVKPIGLTGGPRLKALPNIPLLSDVIPGLKVYAGWILVLPPSTPNTIIEWYTNQFSRAILSKEYTEWAEQNYIIVDRAELNPRGVMAYAEEVRSVFAPVIKNIKVEN
jgi:tripartite-type tricarboxylate transporter receptor subunit TctC